MSTHESLYVDGRWSPPSSTATCSVVCPSTERVIGQVPDCDDVDVDTAVAAARQAFDVGPWPRLGVDERAEILLSALTVLGSKVAEIAHIVTLEMGSPISVSQVTVPTALSRGEYFVRLAQAEPLLDVRRGNQTALVLREPVGVIASIAPWNGPFSMAITKIIPALAAGCAVVFKPAGETPLDSYLLADALDSAGVPPGVFNLLTGGRATGRHLVAHRGIDKVSFTGSTVAGREIGRVCGEKVRPVQLELGGKSAAIVLDDADIDVTMKAMSAGCFTNSGQMCIAFSRVLVTRARYREVTDALCDTARSFRLGDPLDPATTMGPVVTEDQRQRVEEYIESGVAEGAELRVGGKRPSGMSRGWFVEPTVFGSAHNSMRICQEEIFGPVVAVIPFDGIDDAIRIANDSDFGLHGGVFTSDEEAALAIAKSVRTGTFSINNFVYNIEAPFGGLKMSGIGRDTGREAIQSYLGLKTINIPSPMVGRFT
ncbi:MAG: aldehyde dehydrogenase [Mycobacterium sp.]|nr:aldehyde dehydrogenase [Mycobacterium sp.]